MPVRRSDGRPNDAHALRPEHQVVPPRELLVIVANQNARPDLVRLRRPHVVPGLLRHPIAIRVRRHPGQRNGWVSLSFNPTYQLTDKHAMDKYLAGQNVFEAAAIIIDPQDRTTYKIKHAPPHLQAYARKLIVRERAHARRQTR
jgi:hypothetical protein